MSAHRSTKRGSRYYLKATGAALLVVALVAGYVAFASDPALQRVLRPEAVRGLLDGLGPWGPSTPWSVRRSGR